MPGLAALATARDLGRLEPAAAFGRKAHARIEEIARACHAAGRDPALYLAALGRLAG